MQRMCEEAESTLVQTKTIKTMMIEKNNEQQKMNLDEEVKAEDVVIDNDHDYDDDHEEEEDQDVEN